MSDVKEMQPNMVAESPGVDALPAKPKLWTLDFTKIIVVSFLSSMIMQMMMSTFVLYVKSIGGTEGTAGVATAIYTFTALFFRPIAGRLSDEKSRRLVLVFGCVVYTSVLLAYAFFPILMLIFVFRPMQGIAYSSISTSSSAMNADLCPQERLTEGVGYYTIAKSVSMAVAPAIGLWLFGFGTKALFLGGFTAAGTLLLISLSLTYEKKRALDAPFEAAEREQETKYEVEPGDYTGIWKFIEKRVLTYALIQAMISFSISTVSSFLAVYTLTLGIETNEIGAFFTSQAIGMFICRLFAGKLADKKGPVAALVPAMICLMGALIGIANARTLTMFVILAFPYGLGQGMMMPVLSAAAMRAVEPTRRGVASSTYFSSFDVGGGLGAAVWGFVIGKSGYKFIYYAAAGFVALASVMSMVVLDPKRKKNSI